MATNRYFYLLKFTWWLLQRSHSAAANRDPAVFTEPSQFRVDRAENRHIAFGFGIHYCLGAMLAKLEAQVAFYEFFRRFPLAALASDSLRWRPGLVLRCPEKLMMTV